jgi:hypothetical protein
LTFELAVEVLLLCVAAATISEGIFLLWTNKWHSWLPLGPSRESPPTGSARTLGGTLVALGAALLGDLALYLERSAPDPVRWAALAVTVILAWALIVAGARGASRLKTFDDLGTKRRPEQRE